MNRFVYAVVVLGVILFGVGGVWAFGWPYGFFTTIAHYPPYNAHLFHDLGAFQLAVAAALAGGLWWRDALGVGLLGAVVGMAVHAASHVIDEGIGSGSAEMWGLVALGLVFAAALAVRIRAQRPVSMTQNRLPSGSARTTKSASPG